MTDKRALLIGINYIGQSSELRGCINDTKHLYEFLRARGYNDIIVLTDETEEKPTKQNILKYMNELMVSTDSSHRFIGYSGHGSNVKDKTGDEPDHLDECICPVDYSTAGVIIDDVIRETFSKLHPNAKLHGIFDACHSGTICDLRYKCTMKSTLKGSSYILECAENYPAMKPFICILSGCKDNQTSADTREEDTYQGALTYAFLQHVETSVNYKNLIKNIVHFLKTKKYSQCPQLTFGQFVDISKNLDF